MKKMALSLISGVLFSFATAAVASSPTIEAILFPSTVHFHHEGRINTLEDNDNTILNYNNSVYVPLRSFAEKMGATVNYTPPNSETGSLPQIDIHSAPMQWGLVAVQPPGNLPLSPLSLKLGSVKADAGTNSDFIGIYAELFNTGKEIIDITKTKLEIKIEKVTEEKLELVWSGEISSPTSPGELMIPSSNTEVVWARKSPILHWDKKDMNGNLVPPGQYQISLSQPANIEYSIAFAPAGSPAGKIESQTINPDTSNTTVVYIQ